MIKIIKPSATLILLAAITLSCVSGSLAARAIAGGDLAALYSSGGSAVSYSVTNTANSSVSADFTVSDYTSLVRTIQSEYVARVPSFTVYYSAARGDIEAACDTMMQDALKYDDTATTSDLDYLQWNMNKYQYRASITASFAGAYALFTFTQDYRDTAEQENYVNTAVAGILEELNVGGGGAYEKIKAVHDYVVSHVDYDNTLTRYTAYDALSAGKCVCQGYALLTYKLLSELGVPVRIISGQGNGGDHGWNIVKLGQYWYNLDVTWDDTAGTTKYFLKSDAAFSDHTRNSKYATADFYAAHPMSPDDYNPLTGDGAPSAWAKDGVSALLARGVVPQALKSGYQRGITRDEFTALIVSVYERIKGSYTPVMAPPFIDIAGSAYAAQISKGYSLGIIGGTGGTTFTPQGTLTREQCAKIIAAAAGVINGTPVYSTAALPFADAGKIDGWALGFVRYAYEYGLMTGSGSNFEPLATLTREQAMLIAERMIEKYGWKV